MSEQRADDLPQSAEPGTTEGARRLADLIVELAEEGVTLTISPRETTSPRLASTRWRTSRTRGGMQILSPSKLKPSTPPPTWQTLPAAEVEALRARIHEKRKTLTRHGL